ncbi:M23 family metallopeptidase [Nocardia sp. NBC_01499]|uniref:murein hydrolase activator EnvC family protein n=1 Tax=Nocardia sp. NBC_01499 TaxID=2903597 RepID=UPI00386B749B
MSARFWPLARGHVVTSRFGPRDDGYHYGVDFGRPGGSGGLAAHAVQAGTVDKAGQASGFGQWVCVSHADGAGYTVYGHVIPEVRAGQVVEAGQRIARINPDSATNGGVAPHLHLEWHRGRVWAPPGADRVDPLPMLADAAYPGEGTDAPMTAAEVKQIQDFIKGFCGPIGSDAKDIREQLCGQGSRDGGQFTGWRQLGGKSVVDALADIRNKVLNR